jgi:hypothetical protein
MDSGWNWDRIDFWADHELKFKFCVIQSRKEIFWAQNKNNSGWNFISCRILYLYDLYLYENFFGGNGVLEGNGLHSGLNIKCLEQNFTYTGHREWHFYKSNYSVFHFLTL